MGGAVMGAGLERVIVALKSSPAKKADWEGVTVTSKPEEERLRLIN